MPLIKVAYLMLNFLNLKSFLRHLFLGVASCLSTLCYYLTEVPKVIERSLGLLQTKYVDFRVELCFFGLGY